GCGIPSKIPVGRARGGLRQAALARAEAGFVGGRAGRVEADVLAFRGARRAARPAVDARRVHGRDELPVEAGVARIDRAVPLIEGHRQGHASTLTRPKAAGARKSDTAVPGSQWKK